MKRDMDLVRKILLEVEKAPYEGGWVDLDIKNYTQGEVSYHTMLLNDSGLVEAQDLSTMSGPDWRPKRLTWEGHEFLEASRNEERWERAKEIMGQKGGGFVFDILKDLLLQLMRGAILGG